MLSKSVDSPSSVLLGSSHLIPPNAPKGTHSRLKKKHPNLRQCKHLQSEPWSRPPGYQLQTGFRTRGVPLSSAPEVRGVNREEYGLGMLNPPHLAPDLTTALTLLPVRSHEPLWDAPPTPGASQASSHLTFQHIITVDHFLLPRYLCSVTFCCLLSYLGGPSSLSPPLLPPHLPHIWVLGFLGLFLLAHSSGQSLLAMALLTLTLTPRLLSSTQTPAHLTTVLVSRSPCQPNVPEQ